MKLFIALLVVLLPAVSQAAQLYGIDLQSAKRDQLRSAVKNSGLKLVREVGADGFYDIYESDAAISVSSRLYLGFVKATREFAFAEYELEGLKQPAMLNLLKQKYGEPRIKSPRFLSDLGYSWVSEGVQIVMYQDWSNYKTRLLYYRPETLNQLRKEQVEFSKTRPLQSIRALNAAY